jgi:hypothetical protein
MAPSGGALLQRLGPRWDRLLEPVDDGALAEAGDDHRDLDAVRPEVDS